MAWRRPFRGRLSSAWGLLLLGLAPAAWAQVSEAASTAPRGRWLLEADVLSIAFDRHRPAADDTHARSLTAGSTLLSTGLTNRLDAQFGLEAWREERREGPGVDDRVSGGGDGWLRLKWNFAGDESTGPAWAVLPYVKLPLAGRPIGNGRLEPGALLVFGAPRGTAGAVSANAGVAWLDDGGGGRDPAVDASVAVTRTLVGGWSCYGELVYWSDLADAPAWWGQAGAGLVRTLGDRGWIDAAVYVGLTAVAPDVTPVLRCGWQF